jgi:hypothetical protein
MIVTSDYEDKRPIISVNIMGGLGNQMFQLATAYAYAKQNNGKLIILRNKKEQDGRSLYWDTMLYRFQEFLVDKLPEDLEQSYESGATEFTIIPPLTNKGLYINGYLQSPKYFDDNKIQEEESVALAYYYAKQAEKNKQNSQTFWSSIKQLTNNN